MQNLFFLRVSVVKLTGYMPDDPYNSVSKKVTAIFTELAGPERADTLDSFPANRTSLLTRIIAGEAATEERILHATDIAFHLTDWKSDAAFLVALHLCPERFTAMEIAAGIDLFLVHVPAHAAAAAKLSGYEVADLTDDEP